MTATKTLSGTHLLKAYERARTTPTKHHDWAATMQIRQFVEDDGMDVETALQSIHCFALRLDQIVDITAEARRQCSAGMEAAT